MKELAVLLSLVLFTTVGSVAVGQSRRVSPSGTGKPNERISKPEPTQTPIPEPVAEVDQAADSNDVIEVDTRLITVPVRVLDRRNRSVVGLLREDFRVFENGVQQEVSHFTNEAQPFTVALLLDMSYSTVFKINEIQSAAMSFVGQLRPDDRVMVISFDEEVHLLCEATTDRQRIYRAIKSTRISTGTSLYEAVGMTMNDRMRRIPGRKAIVLFTDGVDTTSRNTNDLRNLQDAMELDALIYPIRYDTFADVQSIKNRPISTLPGQLPPTTPPTTPSNRPFPIPTVPSIGSPGDKGTTPKEYADAEEYLNQLALRTGGTVYPASTFGNLNSAFSRIAAELREFYSLGYYPTDEGKPGQTRRIKVRVNKEGVAIRARDGYVVPRR